MLQLREEMESIFGYSNALLILKKKRNVQILVKEKQEELIVF